METFHKGNTIFICNGDFSGEVCIKKNRMNDVEINIPIEDIFNFVAEAVREKKITDIEKATAKELLGL